MVVSFAGVVRCALCAPSPVGCQADNLTWDGDGGEFRLTGAGMGGRCRSPHGGGQRRICEMMSGERDEFIEGWNNLFDRLEKTLDKISDMEDKISDLYGVVDAMRDKLVSYFNAEHERFITEIYAQNPLLKVLLEKAKEFNELKDKGFRER